MLLLARSSTRRAAMRDVGGAAASAPPAGGAGRQQQAAAVPGADPVQRARQRMGYKNRWHRDNVEQRQVSWQQPLRADQPVAVIGGGISGLSCAQGLSERAMQVTVFDTGEHGLGGRAATRTTEDASIHTNWISSSSSSSSSGSSSGNSGGSGSSTLRGAGLLFDHAAQCFTATDPAFQQQCEAWEAAGVVQRWQGPVGVLQPGGRFEPLAADRPVFVAVGGMRRLAQHMAEQLVQGSQGGAKLVQPMWVAKMAAAPSAGGWRLSGAGKDLGAFGAAVIAHNGKCANRLVGPTGAPDVARQLMRLRLSAVWVLMVAFEGPVPVPGGMQGAFVQGSPVLSWAGNNTTKLQLKHPPPHATTQCWTLISTNAYGQANKVPQERVPADVAAKVTQEMLEAFSQLLGANGAAQQLPSTAFTRVQLWGAALPLNSPRVPCILDPAARVGVCGDWLTGASIQAAWLSGRALAARLADLQGRDAAAAQALAVGLQEPFVPLAEAAGSSAGEIGEFPGCQVPVAVPQEGGRRGQQQQPQRRQQGGRAVGRQQGPPKQQVVAAAGQ